MPEACLSPRMPGSFASAISASVSVFGNAGIVSGKYVQANVTGTPAISQWPEGVSLPVEISTP